MTFLSTFFLLLVVVIVLAVLFICVPIMFSQHFKRMNEERDRWTRPK